MDMAEIEVQISLIYGIFVGVKSFLIGTRFLVNKVHSETLTNKILHNRLSQELIDLVIDQLHLMNQSDILARWRAGPRSNPASETTFYDFLSAPATKFGMRPPRYTAQRAVLSRVQQEYPSIRAIWITASRPGSKPNGEPLQHKTYLRLSAFKSAGSKPSLAWNLPLSTSTPSLATTGAVYIGTKGSVTAGLNPGHNTSQDIAIDAAVYFRKPGGEKGKRRGLPQMQCSRLLQCENVAEAIQGWDGEAVRGFVEVFGLKVVSFDMGNGDLMRQGLHIWQRVADCVDG